MFRYSDRCHFHKLLGCSLLAMLIVTECIALDSPGSAAEEIDLTGRTGDEQRIFREIPLDTRQPASPELPLPAPPSAPAGQLSAIPQVNVRKIQLVGNTILTDEDLAPVIEPYQGRTISTEDLFALRNALTTVYINAGYINSGALIPDQKVTDGVIKVQIIEGVLTDININGDNWLRDRYIIRRLQIGNQGVLNIKQLQERMKLLQQDRLIERIHAELIPGEHSGESVLNVKVDESRLYNLRVAFDNHRSPSIGELQGRVYAAVYNLTGLGDALSTHVSFTGGLESFFASYSIPISRYDTRLQFHYQQSDTEVIEEPFDFLKIRSENRNWGVSLNHPIYQAPTDTVLGSIAFEKRNSAVTFQDPQQPESSREAFPSQVENGETRLSVLRFAQEWVQRRSNRVLAVRSTFNWGIDVSPLLDNKERINENQFFSWLGQFQWVQRLGSSNIQCLMRADLQLTPDILLPIEKMTLGGARTVRGYRENQWVRDNGAVVTAEIRVPVFRLPLPWLSEMPTDGKVQLAGFYDFGWGNSNNKNAVASSGVQTISSVGIGVRWDPTAKIHSELYWAIPLRNVGLSEDSNLQDHGINFALTIDLF